MVEDEYDLTPHQELENIKKELAELKKHSVISTDSKDELHKSIKELTIAIHSLNNLFHTAAQDITQGEQKTRHLEKRFDPMLHKMNTLIEQNKKIAAGIVSVADLIREKLEEPAPAAPGPASPPEPSFAPEPPVQQPPGPPFEAPFPQEDAQSANLGAPPLPPPDLSAAPPPAGLDFSQLGDNLPPPPGSAPPPPEKKGLFGKK